MQKIDHKIFSFHEIENKSEILFLDGCQNKIFKKVSEKRVKRYYRSKWHYYNIRNPLILVIALPTAKKIIDKKEQKKNVNTK